MITSHQNRIEQLRQSFHNKIYEAEKWPEKVKNTLCQQFIYMFFVYSMSTICLHVLCILYVNNLFTCSLYTVCQQFVYIFFGKVMDQFSCFYLLLPFF